MKFMKQMINNLDWIVIRYKSLTEELFDRIVFI